MVIPALDPARFSSPSRRLATALAGLLLLGILGAPSAQAVSIPWSVAGLSAVTPALTGYYNLTVNLIAASGTIDLTENVAQTIGLQDFNWSMSADNLGEVYTTVDRSLTVGTVTHTVDQTYAFGSTSAYGLKLKSGAFYLAPTLVFDLGNQGIVDVALLAVTNPGGGGSVGTTATSGSGLVSNTSTTFPYGRGVVATFYLHDVVPEPSTALLLASGLAGIAVAGRRRGPRR